MQKNRNSGNPLPPDRYSAEKISSFLHTKKEIFWVGEGRKRSLALFHLAAKRVPAYKDFLKKNKVKHEEIKTWKDFQNVPLTNKKEYLREYPLKALCWDGSLEKPLVFTSTSGSTGEPFYFPRQHILDWQYSFIVESFLQNSSYGVKGPTLVIIGFGMGVWIGGLITYKAFEIASQRMNHPLSIITPGINKGEILHALRELSPQFGQTIIVGYPPFVKDMIDEALHERINLKKLNIRLFFAAESFSEKFRDYLDKKAGMKNPYLDTLNIYGSADIGAMAYETGASILIKRLILKDKQLFKNCFGQIVKTPTLAQYNPLFITFEAPHGEVALTGDNAVPLIRYAIGDQGGVSGFGEMISKVEASGHDFPKEAKRAGISQIPQLPFVHIYERSDFSTKLYGAIIYPEHIKEALQENPLVRFVTGKFTVLTKLNKKNDQYLEVNIELKRNIKESASLKNKAQKMIVKELIERNAEHRNNHSMIPEKVEPHVVFWPYEHPLYFKPGIKQKWIKK